MKKTYIEPSIEVHKIETANMCTVSNPDVKIGTGSVNAEEVGSRGGSGWDDDE